MAATTKLIIYNEVLRELRITYPLANLTTENPRLNELDGAFDHAVEYVLASADWSFARARSTLSGTTSTAFTPYTYSYTRPSDWLRTAWIKTNAYDDAEVDYAEVGSTIYGFLDTVLIEYISDASTSYDPANWPPHFSRSIVLYLAYLTAPSLARAGDDAQQKFWSQYQTAELTAQEFEANSLINEQIPVNRHPVMRRSLEFLGHVLQGSKPIHNQTAKLRWAMNRSWDHAVRYCLEQGAWNFASRRVRLTGGTEPIPGDTIDDIIEGYSLGPATEPADAEDLPDMSEYDYGFILPSDFLHNIWVRADANDLLESEFQFLRDVVMANYETIIMEYVSNDSDAVNPDNWPATFLEAVAAYLAVMVAPELVIEGEGGARQKMTATGAKEGLERIYQSKLGDAKRKDAIQQRRKRLPPGSFARARMGGNTRLGRLT